MASLISSNFLTTVVAADFKLFRPPSIISFDFFPVKLDGLKQEFVPYRIENVRAKEKEIGLCEYIINILFCNNRDTHKDRTHIQ